MRLDRLTNKFQLALADAQSLALGHDNQFIEPLHLMSALLNQEGGSVSPLLTSAFTSTHLFNRLSNVGGGRPCCFQDVGQRAARLKCRQNEQF